MNKFAIALNTALLIAATPSAFAASSTELAISGLITPSACSPMLSSAGVVDYGKISAKDLNASGATALPNVTLQLTIDCEAATLFALEPLDNRSTSGFPGSSYGIGFVNGTKKLGTYYLEMKNPLADEVPAHTIASGDNGVTWYKEKFMDPGYLHAISSPVDNSTPIPLKNLKMDLLINTSILRTDNMDLSDEVPIDGSASLDVIYL